MQNTKFKIGDKVKILRKSTDDEHDLWGDSWVGEMDKGIGTVATIEYVDCNNRFPYPKYQLNFTYLNFPEFVLQKVVVKGQQLMLFEL